MKSVFESGEPVKGSTDVKFIEIMDGVAVFDVGSGEYSFVSKI